MKNSCRLLWQLKQFDLLAQLNEGQLEELSTWIKDFRYHEDELIYLPGESSELVYFLKKGKVKLSYLDQSGKEFTVDIIDKGELFGEMSLVSEEGRSLKAEAIEDVVLCTVSKRDFLHFIRENPQLSLSVAKQIGQHKREIQTSLTDLIFKDVPTRLAGVLCKMADDYGRNVNGDLEIGLRFTHEELAKLIGSTRETTTARLNEFEADGLIEKDREKIVITDEKGLREKAAGN